MIIIDGDVVNATANYKNDRLDNHTGIIKVCVGDDSMDIKIYAGNNNCKMVIDLARDLIHLRKKHGG